MLRLPSMTGRITVSFYAFAGPMLLLAQNGLVAGAYWFEGQALDPDLSFWLLPLRRLAMMPGLSATEAALAFILSLCLTWLLAIVSFRRAFLSGFGFGVAAWTLVPALQIAAVAVLTLLPFRRQEKDAEERPERNVSHILQGVLVGATIIVFAVLVSAVTFGAYGWGLFVLTPFLVGATTAYTVNRQIPIESGDTIALALAAAGLGSLMLLMLALEGFACIILVAPLAAILAIFGAVIGRSVALMRFKRGNPMMSVALLPAVFAFEAAMPPQLPIVAQEDIEISAPPALVWEALTDDGPIAVPPGLVARAGLAFPLSARIIDGQVGGERQGIFSTGVARERITVWNPGRALAFQALTQPPAMEEMSPYRQVHAPHVHGYFDTEHTQFRLTALPGGGTRLEIEAEHVLRIDPVLYWEPIARWAIRSNVRRVLRDLKAKAERNSPA